MGSLDHLWLRFTEMGRYRDGEDAAGRRYLDALAGQWMSALAQDEGVRAIALYLEADGDGALLCDALAECAERGVEWLF